MVTRFKNGNNEIVHTTQQYQVGLYVLITRDGHTIKQGGSTLREEPYHKKLRSTLKKDKIEYSEY